MQANLGLWLAVMLAATLGCAWNVRSLLSGPARDLRVGLVGAAAILAVLVGAGLVRGQLGLVAFWDLGCDVAVCALLISCWLRSDACQVIRVAR
jgi:hypothetical protein